MYIKLNIYLKVRSGCQSVIEISISDPQIPVNPLRSRSKLLNELGVTHSSIILSFAELIEDKRSDVSLFQRVSFAIRLDLLLITKLENTKCYLRLVR